MPAAKQPNWDTWFQHNVDFATRCVFLGGEEIDDQAAAQAIKLLHALDATDGPIGVKLTTYGGDWYYGMAIYDAIRGCRNEVMVLAYGPLQSMGAIIFQAADVRAMMPFATMMVHYGDEHMSGHALNTARRAQENGRLRAQFEQLMLERINQKRKMSAKQFRDRFAFDVFLDAHAAVDMGLADLVWGEGAV